MNLGNACQDKGDIAGAIAAFRRVLELRPNLVEMHYNLGNAVKNLHRLPEAARDRRERVSDVLLEPFSIHRRFSSAPSSSCRRVRG